MPGSFAVTLTATPSGGRWQSIHLGGDGYGHSRLGRHSDPVVSHLLLRKPHLPGRPPVTLRGRHDGRPRGPDLSWLSTRRARVGLTAALRPEPRRPAVSPARLRREPAAWPRPAAAPRGAARATGAANDGANSPARARNRCHGLRPEPVPDPRRASLGADPARLAEHLEVVADRGLRDVAARREVARAHLVAGRELAQDREPGGVGGALEEQGVRIGRGASCAKAIDKFDIVASINTHRHSSIRAAMEATDEPHPRARRPGPAATASATSSAAASPGCSPAPAPAARPSLVDRVARALRLAPATC